MKVYLESNPNTGTLNLKNSSTKPANVSQNYTVIHITMNGQVIQDAQLGWGASLSLSGLATGIYTISPENINDTAGNTYQGLATPQSVQVSANQTNSSLITYSVVQNAGKIDITTEALPNELSGYTSKPLVVFTQPQEVQQALN